MIEQVDLERLKAKLENNSNKLDNECWEWNLALRNGYGVTRYKNKILYTHRLSYMVFKGLDPKDELVCHQCDNPKCINPNHLFLGSSSDNIKDCYNKNRMPHTSKSYERLSDDKVRSIKKHIKDFYPNITLKTIASILEVSYDTVKHINTGKRYKYIV